MIKPEDKIMPKAIFRPMTEYGKVSLKFSHPVIIPKFVSEALWD